MKRAFFILLLLFLSSRVLSQVLELEVQAIALTDKITGQTSAARVSSPILITISDTALTIYFQTPQRYTFYKYSKESSSPAMEVWLGYDAIGTHVLIIFLTSVYEGEIINGIRIEYRDYMFTYLVVVKK